MLATDSLDEEFFTYGLSTIESNLLVCDISREWGMGVENRMQRQNHMPLKGLTRIGIKERKPLEAFL